jgi:hypothetical protein
VKIAYFILIITLIMPQIAYAQAQAAPQQGGGLDMLIQAIDRNSQALNETQKKIEDQYGFLAQQNRQWSSTLIVGNSAFMLVLYLLIVFFDRLRRRRHKKTHEEYIKQLEDKLIATEKGVIETLKYVNDETTLLLLKNKTLQEQQEMFMANKPPVRVMNKTSFLIGVLATLAMLLIAQHMGAV